MLRLADAATATTTATATATAIGAATATATRSAAAAVAATGRSHAVHATSRNLSDTGRLTLRRLHPSRGFRSSMLARTSMLRPRRPTGIRARAPRGAMSLAAAFDSDLDFDLRLLGGGSGVTGCGGRRSRSSSASRVIFTAPPEDLEEGSFERPTPLLLIAGEGQPATWWSGAASFFASRGCTVGTMALTGRGSSPTETLSLCALQAGVAAAVERSGLTPPVIVAHSMAGFVCQQYLQSYSASGLVLLDSFPPTPSDLAIEHLNMASALAGDIDLHHRHPDVLAETPPGLSSHELAQLMKDNPARWEGLLRTYFEDFHRGSPFNDKCKRNRAFPDGDEDGDESQEELSIPRAVDVVDGCGEIEVGVGVGVGSAAGWGPCFPVKAFAQMCLGQPSSTLRLESHVVETLVLGSGVSVGDGVGNADVDVPSGTSDSSSFGRDELVALNSARRHALEAICEFHGTQGWSAVDRRGLAGSEKAGSLAPWQEAVWDWYHARF